MTIKDFKGQTMIQYLDYQIFSMYNKAHVYRLLKQYDLSMFYYNAMHCYKKRLLNTSIEDLQATI